MDHHSRSRTHTSHSTRNSAQPQTSNDGWEYDPNSNSVVFHEGHVPEPNQTITIEYGIWGC